MKLSMRLIALMVALLLLIGAALPAAQGAPKRRRAGGRQKEAVADAYEEDEPEDGEEEDFEGDDDSGREKPRSTTLTFALEHAVDAGSPATFTPRGDLALKLSLLSGKTVARFQGTHGLQTEEQRAGFAELAKSGAMYRIRTRSVAGDDTSPFVVASVRACVLAELGWEERLVAHVDADGALLGLDYVTPPGHATCGPRAGARMKRVLEAGAAVAFKSTAKVLRAREVPGIPATAVGTLTAKATPSAPADPMGMGGSSSTPEEPVELDEQGNPKPKPAPQGSFFSRYAYIIIPVVALMLLSGGGGEAPKGGPGGGGGGR